MALYAFDGTSREDDIEDSRDTNVVRIARAYRGRRVYRSGVGTRYGAVGKVLGGWIGLGLNQRVDEALDELKKNFATGDQIIDIVGFSRGAASALHFANKIWADIAKKKAGVAPIRFLGLFDTVASTGILPGPLNPGVDLDMPPNVAVCCHAMALDEGRFSFRLQRVKPAKANHEGRIEEVWFRGCHSDIGGGQDHDGLASIPLCWMMQRAAAAGVRFDAGEVEAALQARNAQSKIRRAPLDKRLLKRQAKRGDRIHCSVRDRAHHQNPPERGCLVVDDHGEERGSYPGELDWPFEINWNGALVPTPRLRVGDPPVTIDVLAQLQWNETPHVYLERGGTYRFTVIDGPHDWIDGEVTQTNGAEGYDLPALKPFKRLARLPDAGWMALIGAIDREEHFRIGRQCDYRPQQDGEFSCYANDAWFKYANNRGRLTVSVQRIA